MTINWSEKAGETFQKNIDYELICFRFLARLP
jgi:hypothetical protein